MSPETRTGRGSACTLDDAINIFYIFKDHYNHQIMHQGNEPLINELTLARSGVFSILNREGGNDLSWETTFRIGDRDFFVQGMAARGRPHGVDPDVLLALQTLFFDTGCLDDDTVECTAYALLKLTPVGTRGNAYSRLRDSLLRLEGELVDACFKAIWRPFPWHHRDHSPH